MPVRPILRRLLLIVSLFAAGFATGCGPSDGERQRLDIDNQNLCAPHATNPCLYGLIIQDPPYCNYVPNWAFWWSTCTDAIRASASGKTKFSDQVGFLYKSPTSVQAGLLSNKIDAERVAVVSGVVVAGSQFATAASISVVGDPDYGTSQSEYLTGRFFFVVNGGAPVRLRFSVPGYFPTERTVTPAVGQYTRIGNVGLVPDNGTVTQVTANASNWTVVNGETIDATRPTERTPRIFFPPNNAWTDPSGAPITGAVNVSSKEYTATAYGPAWMPANLPATSGYTYAVELQAKTLAGAQLHPTFTVPVIVYLDNFLNFPANEDALVPSGFYDPVAGTWQQERDPAGNALNGQVVTIHSIDSANNAFNVDTNGDGTGDNSGILLDERQQLKLVSAYSVGKQLWRIPMFHFSPKDWNSPIYAGDDAVAPDFAPGTSSDDTPCLMDGSIIECETEVLGEEIPIYNTPYSLVYRTDRAVGYKPRYTFTASVSGGGIPGSAKKLVATATVGGMEYTQEVESPSGQDHEFSFTWGGTDPFGQFLNGPQPVKLKVGLVYDGTYAPTTEFGLPPNADDWETNLARQEVTLWSLYEGIVGSFDARKLGLLGWTLNVQHAYFAAAKTIYFGYGGFRRASGLAQTISTFAGKPAGLPCVGGCLNSPKGIAFGPDGGLYIAESFNGSQPGNVKRFLNGTMTTVISGLSYPADVAFGPDGSLYVVEKNAHRIKRRLPNGNVVLFAGTGVVGDGGNGPALSVALGFPEGIAVDADGTVYVADSDNSKIRRITQKYPAYPASDGSGGVSTTVVNTGGEYGSLGDDVGFATSADLKKPIDVALRSDGALLILDHYDHRVRIVDSAGIIHAFAGGGTDATTEGISATSAQLNFPAGIAVGPDDAVFVADSGAHRVRKISQGVIVSVAGSGGVEDAEHPACSGDGGPAIAALTNAPWGVAVDAQGALYMSSDLVCNHVRKISPPALGLVVGDVVVPSADGSEIYHFNDFGRHLSTKDARTGKTRFTFIYNDYETTPGVWEPLLYTIRDERGASPGFSLDTRIDRFADGTPAQFSLVYATSAYWTALTPSSGNLQQVGLPGGGTYTMTYDSGGGGLLTDLVDPRGNSHHYEYDAEGRLRFDRDPKTLTGDAFRALTRDVNGSEITINVTTPADLVTSFFTKPLSTGTRERIIHRPDGTDIYAYFHPDGSRTVQLSDGSLRLLKQVADPRFGLSASTSEETLDLGSKDVIVTGKRTVSGMTDPLTFTQLTEARTLKQNATDAGLKYQEITDRTANEIRWTTPGQRNTKATLNSNGAVSSISLNPVTGGGCSATAETLPVNYEYDSFGRLQYMKQGLPAPAGPARWTRFDYHAQSGLLWKIHRGKPGSETMETRTLTRDFRGRLTQLTNAAASWSFTWDGNDNLETAVTPLAPSGTLTHYFTNDSVNLLTKYDPAPAFGADQQASSYDTDRRWTADFSSTGTFLQPTYDTGTGVLSQITGSTGAPMQIDIGHDTAGRVDSLSRDGILTGFGYGGFTKLPDRVSTTWPTGGQKDFSFTYDGYLRRASESVTTGATLTYGYDSDSLVTSVSSTSPSFTFSLPARSCQSGRLTSATLGSLTTTYGWDTNAALPDYGDLNSITTAFSGTTKYTLALEYDDLARIKKKTETIPPTAAKVTNYLYDGAGRLSSVAVVGGATTTYLYQPNGNLEKKNGAVVGTYDAYDRILTWTGPRSYAHDGVGRRIRRCTTAAPCNAGLSTTTTYEYDDPGRIKKVTFGNGDHVDYTLDGLGRRVTRKLTLGSTTTEKRYLYGEGNRLVAELSSSGAVASQFVYATGSHVPDVMIKGTTVYRILTDHLGSVRVVVDASTGSPVQQIDYDTWGTPTLVTTMGPGNTFDFQPFGFAGGIWDDNTKLVHMGAREYDPEVGRWTTKDPSLFEGGPNLFAYANNDPVNFIDVTGMSPWLAGAGAAASSGGIEILFQLATNGGREDCLDWANIGVAFALGGIGGLYSRGSTLWRELYSDTGGATAGAIRLAPRWRPRSIDDPRCLNGCENVANQIQKYIGGDKYRIEGPKGAKFLGYRGKWLNWSHHDVVVKDGRVYDAFTGHKGVPIDEFKALWKDSELINWRF